MNIYKSLYRTLEDSYSTLSEAPIRLFQAFGVDNKYSIAAYVQMKITHTTSHISQDVSFRMHVKNDEAYALGETKNISIEKDFIEITDFSPVAKLGENVSSESTNVTGALAKCPINIYKRLIPDNTNIAEYYIRIKNNASTTETSAEYIITHIIVRSEIFFGGIQGTVEALTEDPKDINGTLLVTLDGSTTNNMRSLKMDTLVTDSVVISELKADTLNAQDVTVGNEATIEGDLTVINNASISGNLSVQNLTYPKGFHPNKLYVGSNSNVPNNGDGTIEAKTEVISPSFKITNGNSFDDIQNETSIKPSDYKTTSILTSNVVKDLVEGFYFTSTTNLDDPDNDKAKIAKFLKQVLYVETSDA